MITKYDIGQQIKIPATIKAIGIDEDGEISYQVQLDIPPYLQAPYFSESQLMEAGA